MQKYFFRYVIIAIFVLWYFSESPCISETLQLDR